jgi:hypothetical protein
MSNDNGRLPIRAALDSLLLKSPPPNACPTEYEINGNNETARGTERAQTRKSPILRMLDSL